MVEVTMVHTEYENYYISNLYNGFHGGSHVGYTSIFV